MAKKGPRETIKLVSTSKPEHFYTTKKNKRNTPEKLKIKKYNPFTKKHEEYKEAGKLK